MSMEPHRSNVTTINGTSITDCTLETNGASGMVVYFSLGVSTAVENITIMADENKDTCHQLPHEFDFFSAVLHNPYLK